MSAQAAPYRLDPCPASERVGTTDLPHRRSRDQVEPSYTGATGCGREDEEMGDDGVLYQKCGGGRRILRKKIGGN